MQKVLHLLITDYKVDSRVRNETESLLETGYQIDVFCLKSNDTIRKELRRGINIIRYGFSNNKITKILTAYIQFIYYSLKGDYRLVHAHDFTALPAGFIISVIKRIPLIYDTHELWSESEHESYPSCVFKIAYWIEKYFARKANYVITVSDSIKDYLRVYFNNPNLETVRNIPSYTHQDSADLNDKKSGVEGTVPTFIFAGSIDRKRGLNTILQSLGLIGDLEYKFLFLVDELTGNEIVRQAGRYELKDRVIIEKVVPQDKLIEHLSHADIGVHAIENSCLNHEYCLPNKIFEYINAGLAILCTDVKEMSQLVHTYDIGMTFRSSDVLDLAEKMRSLLNDKKNIKKYKSNAQKLSKAHSWEEEYKKLKKIYKGLILN